MTRRLTATDVKTKLHALLDEVAAGEVIEITRRARVVARLEPARGPQALKGMFAGIVTTNASDEELFTTGARWECADED